MLHKSTEVNAYIVAFFNALPHFYLDLRFVCRLKTIAARPMARAVPAISGSVSKLSPALLSVLTEAALQRSSAFYESETLTHCIVTNSFPRFCCVFISAHCDLQIVFLIFRIRMNIRNDTMSGII